MASDLAIKKSSSEKKSSDSDKMLLDENVYKTPAFIRRKKKAHND